MIFKYKVYSSMSRYIGMTAGVFFFFVVVVFVVVVCFFFKEMMLIFCSTGADIILTLFKHCRRYQYDLNDQYGPGSGLITVDDLLCEGDESDVSECRSREWSVHDCGHDEDVVIECCT